MAKECAQVLRHSDEPLVALRDVMKDKFVDSEFLSSVKNEKLGGAICLHFDQASRTGAFLWTHTTASMGLAYQTTLCEQPTAKMSRLPKKNPPQEASNGLILVEKLKFRVNVGLPQSKRGSLDNVENGVNGDSPNNPGENDDTNSN